MGCWYSVIRMTGPVNTPPKGDRDEQQEASDVHHWTGLMPRPSAVRPGTHVCRTNSESRPVRPFAFELTCARVLGRKRARFRVRCGAHSQPLLRMISAHEQRPPGFAAISRGDPGHGPPESSRALADQLLPLFYDDLKRMAHRERNRVGAGATLQTTALVNEAYMKLRGSRTAGTTMRISFAPPHSPCATRWSIMQSRAWQDKRGDGAPHVSITGALDVANRGRRLDARPE